MTGVQTCALPIYPFLATQGLPASDRTLSERTSQLIDAEVSRLVDQGLARARAIVRFNRVYLEKLAVRLLTIESLEGGEVREILRGATVPPAVIEGRRPWLAAEETHPAPV